MERYMNTGIVRRIDDLGRIVIPKEMRRKLQIKEGDPLEIGIADLPHGKKAVCFTRYEPLDGLRNIRAAISRMEFHMFSATCNHAVIALVDNYGIVVNKKEKGKELYAMVEEDGRLFYDALTTEQEVKHDNMRTICCKIRSLDEGEEPVAVAVLAYSVNVPDETKRAFLIGCAAINAMLD